MKWVLDIPQNFIPFFPKEKVVIRRKYVSKISSSFVHSHICGC